MSIIQFQPRKVESNKLESLLEVLPYINLYNGEVFVVHCDGEILYKEELLKAFAQDVALLKGLGINLFVVHGGDFSVNEMLTKFNLTPQYIDEMRVLDSEAIEVAEMVLSGLLNKRIVSRINDAGGMAVGLSGKDCNLIEAKKFRGAKSQPDSNIKNIIDLGFVGEPTSVNPEILLTFEEGDIVPVISPIAIGENAETFYVNPTTVSGVIASSLSVCKYIVITDYPGLVDQDGKIIANMEEYQLKQMSKNRILPKELEHIVHTSVCVLENGTEAVHIINGKLPHALLLEIFSETGVGTCISSSEE